MAQSKQRDQNGKMNGKMKDLAPFREDSDQAHLTTDQGLRINDDQNSLKAGERGGSLLEDFILREKITHFDHERIPERVVHARGAGAHGYFQVYKSMAQYTTDRFLQDPAVKTPIFAHFWTGSAGIVVGKDAETNGVAAEFIKAVAQHRHWSRERQE